MNSLLLSCATSLAIFSASLTAFAGGDSTPAISGKEAFEMMKKLAGEWEGKAPASGKMPAVTVTYRVTAAGSAVVETLFPGTGHEMVTMYTMEGDKLALTHYCAMGNQPHMVLNAKSTATDLIFDFAGGANINPAKDIHMHSAHIHFDSTDRITGEWVGYADGKPTETTKFDKTRKKAA
jgi:hypothetical protein